MGGDAVVHDLSSAGRFVVLLSDRSGVVVWKWNVWILVMAGNCFANDKLPNKFDQLINQRELLAELDSQCEPRQRALLRLLATANRHKLDQAELLECFSRDLPVTPLEHRRRTRNFFRIRVAQFCDELNRVQAVVGPLATVRHLLPKTVELALRLKSDAGLLNQFYESWLDRQHQIDESATRPTALGILFRLFLVTLIGAALSLFILFKNLTTLQKIAEEYGFQIDENLEMAVLVGTYILACSCTITIIGMLALMALAIPHGIRRWNPFVWQTPMLSVRDANRTALAVLCHHAAPMTPSALYLFRRLRKLVQLSPDPDSTTLSELDLDWQRLAKAGVISKKECQVLSLASNPQVQSWLVLEMAGRCQLRQQNRRLFIASSFAMVIKLILVSVVILLSCLITWFMIKVLTLDYA
jgi:hypothetical protein